MSTLSPEVCKLRMGSCKGDPTLVGLWFLGPFLFWGAVIGERRGRVLEKQAQAPQRILGSSTAVL